MHCEICGVKTIQDSSKICFMCNWLLGEGYSVEQLKEIIKTERAK